MKKIRKAIGYLLVAVGLVSCDANLDINKDPYYPVTASTPLLFSSGTGWTISVLGSDVQLVGALWAQHYSQNNTSQQYTTIDNYNLTNSSSYFTRYWSSVYAGALPDLKLASKQAYAAKDMHYYYASQILMAFNFSMLTNLYDNIPFTQALSGQDNLTPTFQDGKTVDAALIKLIDNVLTKKDSAAAMPVPMTKDMIFNGDIAKWTKFAKTLKLKILMKDFDNNKAAITALLADPATADLLSTDAKVAQFTDAANKSNPLYENDRRKLNTTSNIRVSATLVYFLKKYNDPRIASFCEPVTQYIDSTTNTIKAVTTAMAPYYRGLDQGTYGSGTFSSSVFPTTLHSRAVLAATDPVYLMSAAESAFLQAEAWARLNNSANAKTCYNTGVTAAFTRWGCDASSFIAAGGAYELNTSSTDAMLKGIMTQKWLSSVRTDSWNAFMDICRTGIPARGTLTVTNQASLGKVTPGYVAGTLTPSVMSVLLSTQYPHRFLYPKTSSDYNPNTPAVVPLYQSMWWQK